MNGQFPFECETPEKRRKFLHRLKEIGVKEVEYKLKTNSFTPVQAKLAKQWIADSANGQTIEEELRYIVDQLEVIKTKFEQRGRHRILPAEIAAKAKALFAEADELASLRLRISNPTLSHLKRRVFSLISFPLIGYSEDYIFEMTELIRNTASALRFPISAQPHVLHSTEFVNKQVIASLMAQSTDDCDTNKLVRCCEELNFAFASGNYYSCAMLTRAIIDHVPPLFDEIDFKSVAAHWPNNAVKKQLEHLENVTKQVGHIALHTRIKRNASPLNQTSIDCRQPLDTLLKECIRRLKESSQEPKLSRMTKLLNSCNFTPFDLS